MYVSPPTCEALAFADVTVSRLHRRNADIAPHHSIVPSGHLLEIPGLSGESVAGSDSSFEDSEGQPPHWAALQGLSNPFDSRSLITCYRVRCVTEFGP